MACFSRVVWSRDSISMIYHHLSTCRLGNKDVEMRHVEGIVKSEPISPTVDHMLHAETNPRRQKIGPPDNEDAIWDMPEPKGRAGSNNRGKFIVIAAKAALTLTMRLGLRDQISERINAFGALEDHEVTPPKARILFFSLPL